LQEKKEAHRSKDIKLTSIEDMNRGSYNQRQTGGRATTMEADKARVGHRRI
jgi:hypothetical protein